MNGNERAAASQDPAGAESRGIMLIVVLTVGTMLAFAANSLLTRLALQTTAIDPASFVLVRLASGAGMLALIVMLQRLKLPPLRKSWLSALLLFIYAVAFSFAYRSIDTGAGALLLFASAQLTMIAYGYARGERASLPGALLAIGGLVAFLAPGASAPALLPAGLMMIAGIAWGGFSLLGRFSQDTPVGNTASSFIWALPLALGLMFLQRDAIQMDGTGVSYALLSGALMSGLGYAVWYWVRVRMTAIAAGSVQLSVPVLSALLGMLVLGEQLGVERWLAGTAVLAGVAIITLSASRRAGQRKG
ncbi:DMT family transporter [Thauera linaloolentis]|uniref:EamA domain-containing protein n=1 Tax=Thauera linaloolentis (strain DSM 12138 / JCM 21573 / CCUG 41526 / CIP 105981 / IAM 15112 / NBRC 102519 / 47Lol) TaxID=1123367 RepID=N6XXD4_THAL4|nr:DMT family transporter [Thauera linaloolentis]ENO83915.1 hypothetical protein C666_18220 [Thauera linaloolentis 47Lol = DSM 12138]MCM8566766.1 DMT family transporter [Thauera linaloolentis]